MSEPVGAVEDNGGTKGGGKAVKAKSPTGEAVGVGLPTRRETGEVSGCVRGADARARPVSADGLVRVRVANARAVAEQKRLPPPQTKVGATVPKATQVVAGSRGGVQKRTPMPT